MRSFFSFSNVDQYPDFTFIARPTLEVDIEEPSGGYELIASTACLSRSTRDRIFAIAKKDFQVSQVGFRKAQIEYFKRKKSSLLDSGIETVVSPIKSYDTSDQRTDIVETYKIRSLDKSHFSAFPCEQKDHIS